MDTVKKVCLDEPEYPALLREIKDPPAQLYYIGDLGICAMPCAAVVGSRKGSLYGRWAASFLAEQLALAGAAVVSGMAFGADTEAHKGALKAGGKTIAVLGCGADVPYPAGNRSLWRRIAEEGLILSEYEPGTRPQKYYFPARNRIISGLSRLTVVAEAGLHSGSLITAGLAAEQGREVFAVPGNINNIYAIGCNRLIQDGAQPVTVAEDLLDAMGLRAEKLARENASLSPEELRLLSLLGKGGERSIGELALALEQSTAQTAAMVTILEMKGLIRSAMGKVFLAKSI
jgi:DNA processing protein